MNEVVKSTRWLGKARYLLLALAVVAGMVIVPGEATANTEPSPMFVADKTEVDIGENVTFTNLTTGGTHPYTKAQWDFDDDGNIDLTLTGNETQVMESVTYAYNAGGVYTGKLQMTDSTPATLYVGRVAYIWVNLLPVGHWTCPIGGVALIAPNPGAGRPFLAVVVPCSEITVYEGGAQLWGIYYLDETVPGGKWLYYIPGFTSSTLTQLEPGKYYYVVVSDTCLLAIPQ